MPLSVMTPNIIVILSSLHQHTDKCIQPVYICILYNIIYIIHEIHEGIRMLHQHGRVCRCSKSAFAAN